MSYFKENIFWVLFDLFLITLVIILLAINYGLVIIDTYNPKIEKLNVCETNLRSLRSKFLLYKNKIRIRQSDGNEYWLKKLSNIVEKEENRVSLNNVLSCPFKSSSAGSVNYWVVDLTRVDYSFKNLENKNVPLIGDDPENHKEVPLNVILTNGKVVKVKEGDDLWKKAYGRNGLLIPPR